MSLVSTFLFGSISLYYTEDVSEKDNMCEQSHQYINIRTLNKDDVYLTAVVEGCDSLQCSDKPIPGGIGRQLEQCVVLYPQLQSSVRTFLKNSLTLVANER